MTSIMDINTVVQTVVQTGVKTDVQTDGKLYVYFFPWSCCTCCVCGTFHDKCVLVGMRFCIFCVPLSCCDICCIRRKFRDVEWKDDCCQSTGTTYQTPPWWWWYSHPYDADTSSDECCQYECCFECCDILLQFLGMVLMCAGSVV